MNCLKHEKSQMAMFIQRTGRLSRPIIKHFRKHFIRVSKLRRDCISFVLLRLVIGPKQKKLAPSSQPIRCKTNINWVLATRFFPRFMKFAQLYFEFHCLFFISSFFLISFLIILVLVLRKAQCALKQNGIPKLLLTHS